MTAPGEDTTKVTLPRRVRFGMAFAHQDDWARVFERVQQYEDLGLDCAWIADHFVYPWQPAEPWLEAWSLLAGLAARTQRIRLGSLVTHVVYRNPAVLARAAMTVDRISGGRLELGIGAGASSYDWSMTGGARAWSPAERVEHLAEAVEIVDGLLRGTLRSYAGRHYQVADVCLAPGPVQQPRPRLVLAATGRRMLNLAARFADAWVAEGAYPELRGTPATLEDLLLRTRERTELLSHETAALGRDPSEIGRIFVVGFSPVAVRPWDSVAAFEEFIGRFIELGFDEFVLPEPTPAEWPIFERAATEVMSRLAARAPVSTGTPAWLGADVRAGAWCPFTTVALNRRKTGQSGLR